MLQKTTPPEETGGLYLATRRLTYLFISRIECFKHNFEFADWFFYNKSALTVSARYTMVRELDPPMVPGKL